MEAKKLHDTEVLIHNLESLIRKAPNAFGIGAIEDTLEGAKLYRDKTLAELTKKYEGKHCITPPSKFSATLTLHSAKIIKATGANEKSIIVEVEYTDQVGWDYQLLSQLTLQE